jgi:hypothetical protein
MFRFFPSGGIYTYIGGREVSRGGPGGLPTRGREPGAGHAALGCGWPMAPLCLLFGLLEALVNIRRFGFCFVQFRKYFLCNFSETQKQQKTGNWHCGISLIGQFQKMRKNATKCNKT